MAKTGPADAFDAEIADARASTDAAIRALPEMLQPMAREMVAAGRAGTPDAGLLRVVGMSRDADRVQGAQSLADIRPDLADEERFVDPERKTRLLKHALIRPTGPRRRLSPLEVVLQRSRVGLDEPLTPPT
jgi:hypothetical protein